MVLPAVRRARGRDPGTAPRTRQEARPPPRPARRPPTGPARASRTRRRAAWQRGGGFFSLRPIGDSVQDPSTGAWRLTRPQVS
jgi:hypothetical protein